MQHGQKWLLAYGEKNPVGAAEMQALIDEAKASTGQWSVVPFSWDSDLPAG
jgi:hypothetical protein